MSMLIPMVSTCTPSAVTAGGEAPCPDGAAKESNLPSGGLPRPAGFEDRMGHQTPAAPPRRLRPLPLPGLRELPEAPPGRRVLDQRREAPAARLLALGARDPVDRRAAVP